MKISWVVWWLVAILLSPLCAQERYTVKDHGISFIVPDGFSEQKCDGNIIAEFTSGDPETGGLFEIRYVKAQPPLFLKGFTNGLKAYNSKTFKDSRTISEKDLVVGGAKASQSVASYSTGLTDKVLMQTIVARSPMRYYIIEMLVRKVDHNKFATIYDKVIDSFTFGELKFTDDEEKAYKNTLGLLNGLSDVNKELFGEKWYVVTINGKKIGHYWRKISQVEVASKRGYQVETELTLLSGKGATSKINTKSEMSFDFKVQNSNSINIITKEDGTKTMTVQRGELSGGSVNLEREINGEKESVKVDVKNGVFLPDAIDVLKLVTLSLPKSKYLAFYLPLGENSPIYDFIETAGKSWIEEVGSDAYIVYTNREKHTNITNWFDESKNMIKEIVAGSPIIIKAATKEEALK